MQNAITEWTFPEAAHLVRDSFILFPLKDFRILFLFCA